MMIRVLSEETINKIAAGEVIENPASVIKELIENALDAGASHLAVEIKSGGFQLIRVSDDGAGMGRDDAILCFERHATSKISSIDDLSSLHSMGFRGEALASIAAISKITLTTALSEKEGTQVEIEGGKILSISPAPRTKGTTFEIRSLFYNVPARRKFQKQPAAAASEIHKLLITLALAHPEIGFELISNEAEILKVAPAHLDRRIADLFQGSFLSTKLPVFGERQGYRVHGYLGTSADHRVNRTGQYLFVNRRPIFSSQVSYAVKEGYGQRLDEDRFPVFVLHLELPPHLLDVNVHPQKKEVRFQEGEFLRQFVKECVQEAFAPAIQTAAAPSSSRDFDMRAWESKLLLREEPPSTPDLMENEHAIGLFEHYLLLDGSTVQGFGPGIVWVDLQKAQEQLICRDLNTEIVSQGLLLPLPIELSSVEAREFSSRQTDLAKFGFTLQSSGRHSFLIEAIPPFLEEGDAVEAIRLVLQSEEPFLKLSKTFARFALRRKKRFMLQEGLTLWKKLKQLGSSEGLTFTGMHDIEGFFK